MKRAAILAAFVVFASSPAMGQDLQYRMTIKAEFAGMENMNMPMPAMTVYYSGSKMRIESEVQVPSPDSPVMPDFMKISAIVDRAAGKMLLLNENEKEYDERPFSMTQPDSAQLSSLAQAQPQLKETGDTLTINGYQTRRFLMSMELPFNPMAQPSDTQKAGRVLMVMENWTSTDTTLAEAYRTLQALMPAMASGTPDAALLNQSFGSGFPLRSTMLMVRLPETGTYDVDRILKSGAAAEGVQLRIVTEMKDIKTGKLDPALFVVPAEYRKRP